jgi:hypothetical protein
MSASFVIAYTISNIISILYDICIKGDICSVVQAVGEVPEETRDDPFQMDMDQPSATSRETSTNGASNKQLLNGDNRLPRWKKRGLCGLQAPHVRPLQNQEVLQTIKDGSVTDWDLWDAIIYEALVYEPIPLYTSIE